MRKECSVTLKPEMSVGEHQLLLSVLRLQAGRGKHLEIGTAAGGSLCAMLGSFSEKERPQFVVVDPMAYFPSQMDTVKRNLREHHLDPALVDFRIATSVTAFRQAETQHEEFGFILVDGCHKIRSVMNDLKWLSLLNVGGVVCFHDFLPKNPGVWLAVRRFLKRHQNYEVIGQVGSLLAVKKTAASIRPEVTALDQLYARLLYLPLQIERKLTKFRRAA